MKARKTVVDRTATAGLFAGGGTCVARGPAGCVTCSTCTSRTWLGGGVQGAVDRPACRGAHRRARANRGAIRGG
jgi:hypothetical protein